MKIDKRTTPHHSSRGQHKPLFICWHIADGTYNGTISWETNPSSKVSSHFVLGKNGEVTQMVELDRAAWTQGDIKKPSLPYAKQHPELNPNLYCVSIECEGFWKDTKGKLTDKALESAVELTKHIVAEVKRIYGVEIPIDREHIIGHYQINSVTRSHCPGELFPFDELIAGARGEQPLADKPAGKPVEHPQADKKLLYTVQVGAFASAKSAADLYAKLDDMGYFVFFKNDALAKVCVGKFATQEEAQKTADDLKKKGFGGFVNTI